MTAQKAASLPGDTILSENGLAPEGSGRLLLIACGALAREILALKRINGWDHIDLTCLPANLHLYPEKITAAVEEAVLRYRDEYDDIFVVYADCGTGGQLLEKCKSLGVEMVEGPHCYSFFEGNAAFAETAEDEITAFYLTDFLTRQFDAFVWKPMGFDRHPELIPMMFGNYDRLIYQAQTDDPALDAKAREAAERLGLRYERRFTGYGDLATSLANFATKSGNPA
ncbi:DUF1638 domain-containing protein [Thioclava sp. F36-7]|uniref:DUF1638 domain-containing protein n=1 Tax=Thioclava sp. F36-7 TaxID=1915317 RepID=UPI00099691DD|nr:DUF1638 domain-containing protein [Thioclava sp. F36-7]OOY09474.1 hypothetical protein BMI89_06600 [Thioclava sp. F36-7]